MLEIQEIEKNQFPKKSYLYYCYQAMLDLYESIKWVCFHEDALNDDNVQIYERNYIISLTSMLCKKCPKVSGIINGEVAKRLDSGSTKFKEEYIKIKKKMKPRVEPSNYVFPDFLIHESHSTEKTEWTRDKQHIIIEAKTKKICDKKMFFLDFLKLNFYLGELNFDNAIYIIVQTPLSAIKNYLKKYEKEVKYLHEKRLESMFFFIQETLECEPKIYRITCKKTNN